MPTKHKTPPSEIIAEVRTLADSLAIYRPVPGNVLQSTKDDVRSFLSLERDVFGPWMRDRKYTSKRGTGTVNGVEYTPLMVHDRVIDTPACKLCSSIHLALLLVEWKRLPDSQDWSDDYAEQQMREAFAQLPELCDRLEIESGIPTGRKADADRTQKKISAKNMRTWDANCKRMARAYIRQCVRDGKQIARRPFITEELRKNGSLYPNAKSAATIDKAFQLHPDEWKPALSEALARADADRTH